MPIDRTIGGYWVYASKKHCLLHYFQMCMYMRRNFTFLGVSSLCSLLNLSNEKAYKKSFSRGFNPQLDDDIVDLAMLMQQYEKGLKGDELMMWSDISNEWQKFLFAIACV